MPISKESQSTIEDLMQLVDDDRTYELIDGELVEKPRPDQQHTRMVARLVFRLSEWAIGGPGGEVGVESGFVLGRNPDLVRLPDVAYIGPHRLAAATDTSGFWELPPDLAVKVVLPNETAHVIREKVRHYLDAGTSLVWLLYPNTCEVLAYAADGNAHTYRPANTLRDIDLLPGFVCPVAALFG